MPQDFRLRAPDFDRDPPSEWAQKPSTKADLEELRAKVNTLEYGGITADKLGGGIISSQSIQLADVASLYSGSSATNGFVLDKTGLRFYAGGVNTIDLRADGGTATFTGTISASTITGGVFQTATSGKRIKISSTFSNLIQFYSGHASETTSGGLYSDSVGDVLFVKVDSPRAGFDYVRSSWFGRSASGPEAQFAVELLSSTSTTKGLLIFGSKNGAGGGSYLEVQDTTDVLFNISTGYFHFARPTATNAMQLRFQSPTAGGTSQAAIGIDHGAAPSRLNVQAWDGTTPLAISASAFTVISKMADKKNIVRRTGSVLNKVKALKPVNYTRAGHKLEKRKEDDPDMGSAPDENFVGFLAEDFMTQFPEAVVKDSKGDPHSIDLMAVVAILTQAVQELAGA